MVIGFLNWKPSEAVVLFKSARLVIVSLSRKVSIWSLEINLFLGSFRVVLLVGSNDDDIFSSSLEYFAGMGFIDHFKFDFPPRTMYFSSKWNSHKTECFVSFQSLRLTNRVTVCSVRNFSKENETLGYVLFRSWHNQIDKMLLQIY